MSKKRKKGNKQLRRILSPILAGYLTGLSEKKEAKLKKFMGRKLEEVGDYYFELLGNMKKRKEGPVHSVTELPVKTSEMQYGQAESITLGSIKEITQHNL